MDSFDISQRIRPAFRKNHYANPSISRNFGIFSNNISTIPKGRTSNPAMLYVPMSTPKKRVQNTKLGDSTLVYPQPKRHAITPFESEVNTSEKNCMCTSCTEKRTIAETEERIHLYTGESINAPKPQIQDLPKAKVNEVPLWLPIVVGIIFFGVLVLSFILIFRNPEIKPLPIE
jgi:hypothetical protein